MTSVLAGSGARLLAGRESVEQRLTDALRIPRGSYPFSRDYGSLLDDVVDRDAGPDLESEAYAAVAEALAHAPNGLSDVRLVEVRLAHDPAELSRIEVSVDAEWTDATGQVTPIGIRQQLGAAGEDRTGEAGVWAIHLPTNTLLVRTPPLIRWRIGSRGHQGNEPPQDGPPIPADWLVSTVTDRTIYFRNLSLIRSPEGVVSLLVNFKAAPGENQPIKIDPFLVPGVVRDASWTLSAGRTVIDVGGPDHDGAGAVRDTTNPYQWTPQRSAQAALRSLMDYLHAQIVTDDVVLRVQWRGGGA